MSLADKIKNAKPTTWLTDGLTDEEIKRIQERALKMAELELKMGVGFRLDTMNKTISEKSFEILKMVLMTYDNILCIRCNKENDWTEHNEFYHMVEELEDIIGGGLSSYI